MKSVVTIIMATYNRANFIVETLQSIQNQTFLNWECLIIDDGGTDNTLEVITPIIEKDKRFRFFKRPEVYLKGLPGCRNYGLDLAEGNYIIFFDDDDIVHPQNLELCVLELSCASVSFCRYNREVFVDQFDYQFNLSKEYSSFFIDFKDIEAILKHQLPFNSCAVMWKKECFTNDRFEEELMYAEEWELYSRIILSGAKGVSISKTLFFGRKHLNSNTGEFHRKDPIRRASNAQAIFLVTKNLKDSGMLSYSLIRYFVFMALKYREFKLFERIINNLELPLLKKWWWKLFYLHIPIRLYFYNSYKK